MRTVRQTPHLRYHQKFQRVIYPAIAQRTVRRNIGPPIVLIVITQIAVRLDRSITIFVIRKAPEIGITLPHIGGCNTQIDVVAGIDGDVGESDFPAVV